MTEVKNTLVAILTYNEESNIEDCIQSALQCCFTDIIILDGGSTDRTAGKVENLKKTFICLPESSISERRAKGLEYAISNGYHYIMFLDADQRLLDLETHSRVNAFFDNDEKLAGVQLHLVTPPQQARLNYWQEGFYSRHNLITGKFVPKSVIGTPCYFKVNLVKSFDYNLGQINGPSDDTFFCKQLTNSGFKLISVDVDCTEIVRASFKSTVRKAYWYGIGDAEYIIHEQNKKIRKNHIFHVLIRNPIINPLKNLNKFFFFYLIFGISRLYGFLYYYLFRPSKYLTKS